MAAGSRAHWRNGALPRPFPHPLSASLALPFSRPRAGPRRDHARTLQRRVRGVHPHVRLLRATRLFSFPRVRIGFPPVRRAFPRVRLPQPRCPF
jgi:hypothetical protein